jgi:hypothetical protein
VCLKVINRHRTNSLSLHRALEHGKTGPNSYWKKAYRNSHLLRSAVLCVLLGLHGRVLLRLQRSVLRLQHRESDVCLKAINRHRTNSLSLFSALEHGKTGTQLRIITYRNGVGHLLRSAVLRVLLGLHLLGLHLLGLHLLRLHLGGSPGVRLCAHRGGAHLEFH